MALACPALAQDVAVGGQVRPRFEFRDSLRSGGGSFTSMRVRGQVTASLARGVSVFVQFQDVRIWGEETGSLTDFSADHFDLHQGYIEIRSGVAPALSGRIGRQAISLGEERLIGAVEWTQQGRAFDGVRLSGETEAARVDVFAVQLGDVSAATVGADAYLLGAYAVFRRKGVGSVDLFVLYDRAQGDRDRSQGTFGARWSGRYGQWSLGGESAYQLGRRLGLDVAAFMLGGHAGVTLPGGRASAMLWYDYLSGDRDPGDGTLRVFDTLFATNHKFYGLADYFLDIPAQTAGRGLQDLALKARYAAHARVDLAADLHSFRLARSAGLATGHLGEELDLTGVYRYSEQMRLVTGLSYLFAAGGFPEIGRFGDHVVWAYAMLDVTF